MVIDRKNLKECVDKEENERSIIMRKYTERGHVSVVQVTTVGQVISSEAPTVWNSLVEN